MRQLSELHLGIFYALGAYLMWGLAPLYFKNLAFIPASEIVAHRVIWSVLVIGIMISFSGGWKNVWSICIAPKKLAVLAITTLLISSNWLVFIWAINNDRMLDASLGYFINPTFNVILGLLFLKESLSRIKWIGVSLAFIGVLVQVFSIGELPWVSLVLAGSFAFYGLIRKKIKVESLTGLFIETLLLAPLALYFLYAFADSNYANMFNNDAAVNFWLMLAGVVTALPLIFFGQAALRLPLSTLGFFQYLAPSMLFLFAIFLYNEPLQIDKLFTFLFIWSGIVLFAFEKQIKQKFK